MTWTRLMPCLTVQQAFNTCTLKELCPDDKQKVAKLVKQVIAILLVLDWTWVTARSFNNLAA